MGKIGCHSTYIDTTRNAGIANLLSLFSPLSEYRNVRAMLMNFLVVCGAVPLLTIVFTQDVYSGSKFNS